jgi:hypothetical protein
MMMMDANFSHGPTNAKAKVVRMTDEGMGLEFEKTFLAEMLSSGIVQWHVAQRRHRSLVT